MPHQSTTLAPPSIVYHARMRATLLCALASLAGCPSSTQTSTQPGGRCPTALERYPGIAWSKAVAEDAASGLARALLESAWLRDFAKEKGPPRIVFAPQVNRSGWHIAQGELIPHVESRLAGGRVTLLDRERWSADAAKLAPHHVDRVAHLRVEEERSQVGERMESSFVFRLLLAAPGESPEGGKPSWDTTLRVSKTLTPAPLPPGCRPPSWICSESQGRKSSTGCGWSWGCRTGRYAFECASGAEGKRECGCREGDGQPKLVTLADPCSAPLLERALARAANESCGWLLPVP
jgi:hypothetical protein